MLTSIGEGRPNDPLYSMSGIHLLLNRQFMLGAAFEVSADVDVESLRVLAEDDEVDVLTEALLERREPIMEQTDRPKIDVEVQAEAQPTQNIDCMLIRL